MDSYSSPFSSSAGLAWGSKGPEYSNVNNAMYNSGASGSSLTPRDSSRTNLIVNYLPNDMTEKELYAMFVTVGPIESCRVMKDLKTGYSFGFGFVNYLHEDHAMRAVNTLNGLQVQSKRLKVSFARPAGEDIKDTNLYVTNLSRNITDQQLDVIFGKYGHIVQKHILRDKINGLPRGVAFVRYDKREEAQEAISALNNVIPEGGNQPLNVRLADEPNSKSFSKGSYYSNYHMGYPSYATINRGAANQGFNRALSNHAHTSPNRAQRFVYRVSQTQPRRLDVFARRSAGRYNTMIPVPVPVPYVNQPAYYNNCYAVPPY